MTPSIRKLYVDVCDDEKQICLELESMLERAALKLNIELDINLWYSGEDLLNHLKFNKNIDIIFLDIELINMNGVNIGHYIRDICEDMTTQIIYISWKKSYAMKLFKTHPFDFLIKPISDEKLLNVLQKLNKLLIDQNRRFQYQISREIFSISYDEILYFMSYAHKIIIVTRKGKIEYYGKLKDIVLDSPSHFIQVHKSYLVNKNYIVKYTYDFVILNNDDIISISEAYKKIVRKMICHQER